MTRPWHEVKCTIIPVDACIAVAQTPGETQPSWLRENGRLDVLTSKISTLRAGARENKVKGLVDEL